MSEMKMIPNLDLKISKILGEEVRAIRKGEVSFGNAVERLLQLLKEKP